MLRTLRYQSEVFNNDDLHLENTFKRGANGSGSQKNFEQSFEAADSDDSYIFMSSLIPIQLRSTNSRNKIHWQNPGPNSVRHCRPIKMRFVKETSINKNEFAFIDRQIESLLPSSVKINA